jgi:hypothetical protein
VVRDLATRKEREIVDASLLKTSITASADGKTAYFVAKREGASTTDIYSVALDKGTLTPLTSGEGVKTDLTVLRQRGRHVHARCEGSVRAVRWGRAGGGAAGGARETTIVLHHLASGAQRTFAGASAAVSADGSALAFLTRRGRKRPSTLCGERRDPSS